MPRAKTCGTSEAYTAIRRMSYSMMESNDCAVVAVTAVTGECYTKVHALMAAAGRKARHGTPMGITESVMAQLGFRMVMVQQRDFIAKYPERFQKVVSQVTTHHPERFPKAWVDGNKYLLRSNGHILAVINGVNVDWTRGKAIRVRCVYKVEKM